MKVRATHMQFCKAGGPTMPTRDIPENGVWGVRGYGRGGGRGVRHFHGLPARTRVLLCLCAIHPHVPTATPRLLVRWRLPKLTARLPPRLAPWQMPRPLLRGACLRTLSAADAGANTSCMRRRQEDTMQLRARPCAGRVPTIAMVVATVALAATAAAQKPRVWADKECDGFGKACTIPLKNGLREVIEFHLEEPIDCPDQKVECVVVVNISNSHPEWMSISPCLVKWEASEMEPDQEDRGHHGAGRRLQERGPPGAPQDAGHGHHGQAAWGL